MFGFLRDLLVMIVFYYSEYYIFDIFWVKILRGEEMKIMIFFWEVVRFLYILEVIVRDMNFFSFVYKSIEKIMEWIVYWVNVDFFIFVCVWFLIFGLW